jgi:hypothetical protein
MWAVRVIRYSALFISGIIRNYSRLKKFGLALIFAYFLLNMYMANSKLSVTYQRDFSDGL